jgi:hypothetical protein
MVLLAHAVPAQMRARVCKAWAYKQVRQCANYVAAIPVVFCPWIFQWLPLFVVGNQRNARVLQNFCGSGMPRSRQILIAKWLLISLCLGTALRLFDSTCRHQER